MRRRTFIGGALTLAGLAAAGCKPPPPAPKPNLLMIYLDDMRSDLLQFMPQTRALFDHEFTQARASGGGCTDTRLGLFSGTVIQHHPWDWRQTTIGAHDGSKTWGPWLKAAGYRTGMFGKYITTDVWSPGMEPGWDTWVAYHHNAHYEYGYQVLDGTEIVTPEIGNLEYMMNRLIDFTTTGTQPWFAAWSPQHPHTVTETGELFPRPEHADKFLDLEWPVDIDEDVTGKPAWVQALPPMTEDDVLDIQRAARGQAQVLAGVDDEIARLFATLDAAGMLAQTVVFFSSDQGVHYGEHRWGSALGVPAAVQKMTLYDPVLRIPLLARGPGFPVGTTDVPTSQADITATVMALAGAHATHALDGINLRVVAGLAEQTPVLTDRTLLIGARTFFTVSPHYDGVVTGPDHSTHPLMKLARLHTAEVEMYDLGLDPGELVNLADDPDRAAERAALEAVLDSLLVGAPI